MGTLFNVKVGQCNLNLLGINTIHTDLVELHFEKHVDKISRIGILQIFKKTAKLTFADNVFSGCKTDCQCFEH